MRSVFRAHMNESEGEKSCKGPAYAVNLCPPLPQPLIWRKFSAHCLTPPASVRYSFSVTWSLSQLLLAACVLSADQT